MKSSVRSWAVLALVVALPLVGGCGGSALNFNNTLAKANQRLATAGKTFGENLGRALNSGNPGDVKSMEDSYQSMSSVLETIKKEINDYKIEGIDGAKELRDVYVNFLKGQEQMIKVDFKEAMDVVKGAGPDKQGRIQNIMNRVTQTEQRDLMALQNAQRVFAGKHNIKLK